jgi:hypothetical protein
MPQVMWTREIVGTLSDRVRTHNEKTADPAAKTKLVDLKKVYARGYHGRDATACAVNALAKVDRHLGGLEALAKGFDASKHPRGNKGEFTSGGKKGGSAGIDAIPLPKTARQHAKLQETNAAYRALTSDVVPERRNEVIGDWARELGSTALGAGLVLSLAHGGSKGIAARMIRDAGRRAGGLAFGIPTAAVTYTATGAKRAVTGKIARSFGRTVRDGEYTAAKHTTEAATKAGKFAGEKAGSAVVAGARLLVDSANKAGGDLLHRKAAKVATLGGLSIGAGQLINSQIEGGAVDPGRIGAGYDAFSYRTIEKMAGGADALDALAGEYLAKLASGDGQALAKAGFYNAIGMRVLPALAAVGGAAVAGGTAEAVHAVAGNRTYSRDAHGRFTSKANAITAGSALAGALAAGAGAYLALRHHNVRQLVSHVDAVADVIGKRLEEAAHRDGVGHVADLIQQGKEKLTKLHADRAIAINTRLGKDEEYLAERKRLDSFAGSSDVHLKSHIRREVNGKLAEILSQHNDFRVPGTDRDPAKWKTIGEIRSAATPLKADKAAYDSVFNAVDSATPKEFSQAIANLTPGQQETALHWLSTRDRAIEAVPADVKAHVDKIAAAEQKVAAATDAAEAKRTAMLDAKAVVDRTTDEGEKATAQAAFDAANAEHDKAGKAVEAASKALGKLRDAPSGVKSPVTGKLIPPATEAELQPHYRQAQQTAYRRAEKIVDRDIDKAHKKHAADVAEARAQQMAQITLQGDRMLAARAALGHSLGVLPDKAAAAGIQAAALRRFISRAKGELTTARADQAAAEKRVADLKLARKGKVPSGMTAEDTAAMVQNVHAVHDALTSAKLRVSAAEAKLSARQFLLRKHSARFLSAVHEQPVVEGRVGKLPTSVYRKLLRDVTRATEDLHKPVNRFLHSPSAQAFKNFATATGDHIWGGATAAAHAFRDLYRHTLMRKTGEGPDDWTIDPAKVLIRGGLGVVAGDVAHDLYHYGKDQATHALGMGDGKPSKFPRSIKIEKHVDPYTGGGFVGLSVADPDPENKGDRVLLWGEHYKDHTGRAEQLHPGARVSALRNRFQNGQGGGGGSTFVPSDRDIPNLPEHEKGQVKASLGKLKDRMHTVRVEDGHEFKLRPNSDSGEDAIAGKVVDHIKRSFLNSGSPSTGKLYHGALAATLGSNQGRILKQRQVYELLTGFPARGGDKLAGHGIFETGKDSDFGETDNKAGVLDALKDEMKRAVGAHAPANDVEKSNMMRAAAVVGRQKGLSDEDLKSVYEIIRGKPETTAPAAPRMVQATVPSAPSSGKITAASEVEADAGGWDPKVLREKSLPHATAVAKSLGMNTERKIADTATALEHFARQVHVTHGLPMHESLYAAANAVKNATGTSTGEKTITRDALADVDADHFASHLSAAADDELDRYEKKKNVRKVHALDDLEALVKGAFGDAIDAASGAWEGETRVPSGPGGGEFSGGGGKSFATRFARKAAQRLPREGVDESVDRGAKGAVTERSATGSNYTPTKVAGDIGGLALGEAGAYAIGKLFPEEAAGVSLIGAVRQAFKSDGAGAAAQAALKHVAAAPGRVARSVPKLAATSAAGLAGYTAGSMAGEGAARGIYAATGRKAPEAAPPQLSVGEGVAESLGSIGGAILGGTFGAGVGSIATGAAGGYVGGIVGRNVYDAGAALGHLFTGYGDKGARTVAHLRRATQPVRS